MTFALKMASSMCFSSDLMTHLMLLTTCWTSGGRLQLECSRNLATSILVSLYILRSARECGRSLEQCVWSDLGLRWMSTFLPSFCCFLADICVGLPPTTSVELSLGSKEGKSSKNKTKTNKTKQKKRIKSHTVLKIRANAKWSTCSFWRNMAFTRLHCIWENAKASFKWAAIIFTHNTIFFFLTMHFNLLQ